MPHVRSSEQCCLSALLPPTSLNSRMPLGELESKVSLWLLLKANSAMNLSSGVVTCGRGSRQRGGRTEGLRCTRLMLLCITSVLANTVPCSLDRTKHTALFAHH